MEVRHTFEFESAIARICDLNWAALSEDELTNAAWAYYYFSIQFRENLEIARRLYPEDTKLQQLEQEECDTSNLSPWPGVARPDEKMNHDEFMRRALQLSSLSAGERSRIEMLGRSYLDAVRAADDSARALSIASYEDGGLEKVFHAFLGAQHWNTPLLQAFRHFLTQHIKFDSDPEQGHGALSRHLKLDDRILPLWTEFERILVDAAPALARSSAKIEKAAAYS
jgi:hypothetical protein